MERAEAENAEVAGDSDEEQEEGMGAPAELSGDEAPPNENGDDDGDDD